MYRYAAPDALVQQAKARRAAAGGNIEREVDGLSLIERATNATRDYLAAGFHHPGDVAQ